MAPGGVLFSSPIRAHADLPVLVSSSPEFPSISDIVPKPVRKPPLRSGSRAVPIPEDAPKTFTSAANIWRSPDGNSDGVVADLGQVVSHPARMASKSPTPTPVIELSPDASDCRVAPPSLVTKSAKPKAKRTLKKKPIEVKENPFVDDIPASPKPKPRKKSASAKNTNGQTTIPKGKVTKPTTKGKSQAREPEVISKHFQTNSPPVELIEIEDTIELEPALKRRTDWTPTKDTRAANPLSDLVTGEEGYSPSLQDRKLVTDSSNAVFQNLLDTYGCRPLEAATTSKDIAGTVDVLGKRKQLDLVTTAKSTDTSPVKSKAPKKKPRTITELATAAYRVPQNDGKAAETAQPQLLQYFDTDEARQTEGISKPVGGKRRVSKKGTNAKATKAEPRRQILLSPTSAMRQVSRQDFVFGTSSQLATEQDPALLRDLQEAMRVSNQEGQGDDFASPFASEQFDRRPRSRLWAAGARDVDGELLNIEVIDLATSPDVEKDLTNPAVIKALVADSTLRLATSKVQAKDVSISAVEVLELVMPRNDTKSSTRLPAHGQTAGRKVSVPSALTTPVMAPIAPSAIDTLSIDDEPPASNQEQNHLARLTQPTYATNSCEVQAAASRPTYELFTDAQLAKEIQGYGFKVVKRRTAMIALLDQCWASKNNVAPASRAPSAHLSTSSTSRFTPTPANSAPPATRPRGRPRKEVPNTAASTAPASAPKSPEKRPRGRPRTGSSTATSPKTSKTKASPRPLASARAPSPHRHPLASTPTRRKVAAQSFIEIADSDSDDAFASVSSRSPSPEVDNTFSSPLPVDLSIEEDAELSLTVSPTDQQSNLFGFITKAVTTAPRSTDPQNPSWHEKMLMYDPIVLEDLTAWLNSGQLDRVGYDNEVAPGEVKQWCESKSVCCLWRFNLNGKERKRF